MRRSHRFAGRCETSRRGWRDRMVEMVRTVDKVSGGATRAIPPRIRRRRYERSSGFELLESRLFFSPMTRKRLLLQASTTEVWAAKSFSRILVAGSLVSLIPCHSGFPGERGGWAEGGLCLASYPFTLLSPSPPPPAPTFCHGP